MEFKTQNGVDVKINPADFINALKLKNAVLKAVKDSGVDISKIDLDKITASSLQPLLEVILTADTNEAVQDSIFKCLARCLYNGEKIVPDTFEPMEAREDYYEIVIACLKENLSPFFKSPISKLKSLAPKVSDSQK